MLENFYQPYEICWLEHTTENESNQESIEHKQVSGGV